METPVALFLFNRPDTTRKVFEAIRQVKPKQLFVIADGPRVERSEEVALCKETRNIIHEIDWECDLQKNYATINLGLANRFKSGLDWVFENADKCIILEDDCLPDSSFFGFCTELLEKYEDDENIFSITGHNHFGEWQSSRSSYFFSNYFDCWGWATWRRVWQKFDLDMELWGVPEAKEKVRSVIADDQQFWNRARLLDLAYEGKINSWAYSFFFMSLYYEGLTITPSKNLIKNIGFNNNSSNTKNKNDKRSKVLTSELTFPLLHPSLTIVDRQYDYLRYKKIWKRTAKERAIQAMHSLKKKIL